MRNKILNKDKLVTFLFMLIGIVIIGIIGYKIYMDFFNDADNNKTIKRLELYGYSLEKDDTELYKKYFNSLTEVLNGEEINYEKYAELLGSLYIVDFYTLSNKLSSTDVGSLEFVHPDIVDNFKLKATDTVYKYIEVNFDNKREQSLPEVSNVEIVNNEDAVYALNEKEYDAYKISYSWSYIEDLDYETTCELTIIKDGSKLYVVESD